MEERERADKLLVILGHFESRSAAQAAIEAGGVVCNGVAVRKPSQMLPVDSDIAAQAAHPFVSRGGVKLAYALEAFSIDGLEGLVLILEPRPAGLPTACCRAAREV